MKIYKRISNAVTHIERTEGLKTNETKKNGKT